MWKDIIALTTRLYNQVRLLAAIVSGEQKVFTGNPFNCLHCRYTSSFPRPYFNKTKDFSDLVIAPDFSFMYKSIAVKTFKKHIMP